MKTFLIILFFSILGLGVITYATRGTHLFSEITESATKLKNKIYLKPSCYHTHSYFNKLNDSVHNYLEESYLSGIKKSIKRSFEIPNFVKTGALVPLKNNEVYLVDTLKYSYAYLTPKADKLLFEIGKRFQRKIENTNLNGTKLIVTSALRTINKVKLLRLINKNAVKYSAHLHGTTFDITYLKYAHNKQGISSAEIIGLSEVLAKTLYELRLREKCWVTFERFQSCFHIVSR